MTIDDVLKETDNTTFAIALSNLVFPRYDRDGFQALTGPEQVAYCVDALEREVNNGGFDQFFANSSGDTAQETVKALETIGARAAAGIVRRAIAMFPDGEPAVDRDERADQLDAAGEERDGLWDSLDQEFYSYPDDLPALLRRYVEAHHAEFRKW
jgi:hypothetical protein